MPTRARPASRPAPSAVPALSQVRGLLFDLGGTLFEHLPPHRTLDNLQSVFTPLLRRPLQSAELQRYREIRSATETQLADQPFFLHRDLVRSAVLQFAAELQCPDANRAAEAFCDRQRDCVTAELQLRRDAPTTLATLTGAGYPCAIVSNIDEDYLQPLVARSLQALPLAFIISSERAQSCKPDPAIYQQALQRLALAAHQVLFIGDSWTNDVVGPRRAGMHGCWLTTDHDERPPQTIGAGTGADPAVLAIEALSDLTTLLPTR